MKAIGVTAFDDVYLGKDKNHKVLAEKTHHLGLDGVWYELDLTREHAAQLLADLNPWLDAGHRPQGQLYRERPGSDDSPAPAGRRRASAGRAERAELRDFADKHGLAYRTKSGRCMYPYPRYLTDAYLAWQAGAPEAEWRVIYERGLRPRKKDGRR